MGLTENEEKLISIVRKLEGQTCKDDLLLHAEIMLRAQEALIKDITKLDKQSKVAQVNAS